MLATHECLRTFGLAGTTLERVSEQSGLSRSHMRHYVGNRDDLLRRFADWLFTAMEHELEEVAGQAPAGLKLAAVNQHLFGSGFQAVTEDDTVIRELMTAGLQDEALHELLARRYEDAVRLVCAAVKDGYPNLSTRKARTIAYGIWTLAIGNSTMAEIGLPDAIGPAPKQLAESLIRAIAG